MNELAQSKLRILLYEQINPMLNSRVAIKLCKDDVTAKREALAKSTVRLNEAEASEHGEFEALMELLEMSGIDISPNETAQSLQTKLRVAFHNDNLNNTENASLVNGLMRDIINTLHGNPNEE